MQLRVKFSAITKIHKYRKLHEGHHFIPMAMKVHNAPRHFIKECVHLFHDRWLKGHLSLSFCIQFFNEHVNIILQRTLAYAIDKQIALVKNACSRPPITIRFHNLHAGDIKKVVGEIASYHKKD